MSPVRQRGTGGPWHNPGLRLRLTGPTAAPWRGLAGGLSSGPPTWSTSRSQYSCFRAIGHGGCVTEPWSGDGLAAPPTGSPNPVGPEYRDFGLTCRFAAPDLIMRRGNCTVPKLDAWLGPGVSLAELGSSSVFIDHASEESMTPVGVSSRVTVVGPWGGGWCRGLPASRVEVGRTTVGISPGAGARDDRSGVTLVCLSEPGAGAKQERRLFRDLPELLSTAADGPVMCGGFSVSEGQRIV